MEARVCISHTIPGPTANRGSLWATTAAKQCLTLKACTATYSTDGDSSQLQLGHKLTRLATVIQSMAIQPHPQVLWTKINKYLACVNTGYAARVGHLPRTMHSVVTLTT